MDKYSVVGRPVPRVDAVEKVTARAIFGTDTVLPGMLHGKILRSPYAHARIVAIDTSKAKSMPGVRAVLTAGDVPERRMGTIKDQPILAREKVRYIGDAVAAVAAVDEEIAERAVESIEVEYEELPAVFDPQEAMKRDAPLVHEEAGEKSDGTFFARYQTIWRPVPGTNICNHLVLRKGDLEKGFAEADSIFEDTFETPMIHHCYMEPHAAVASVDDAEKVTVWTSTQSPFTLRSELAELFGLPLSKLRVISTRVGGGFGGKLWPKLEPLCIALSARAKKPVKIVMTRAEDFTATAGRMPTVIRVRTGVKKDGTITAREIELVQDAGAYAEGIIISYHARHTSPGPYRVPNLKVDSYLVYTNKMASCPFRGLGVSQQAWAVESQMDMIARRLGIDPVEFRLKNAVEEGDISPTGEVLDGVHLKECLNRAAESIGWQQKGAQKNRGIGIACFHKFSAANTVSSAAVKINEDGSVMVLSGASEIGQGIETNLAQIAAEELGAPVESIKVVCGDTDVVPFDFGALSSRQTVHAGGAVRMAAQDAKGQLLDMASEMLETDRDSLEMRGGRVYARGLPESGVSLPELCRFILTTKGGPVLGRGYFRGRGRYTLDPETGQSPDRPAADWKYYATAAEVEVDPETGVVRVIRLVTAQDVGLAINPSTLEGQMQGSMEQATSGALLEETVFDNGLIINPSFADYRIFTAIEQPEMVSLLVEEPHDEGPYGAKGAGEPPIIAVAPAIANAIYDAVGVRIKDLPITPEKVLKALEEKEGAR
ncbi:MAG: xanthine dehydrogenase family protein molybdopterin-binding subunit [Dehalococcoidia bacterium]